MLVLVFEFNLEVANEARSRLFSVVLSIQCKQTLRIAIFIQHALLYVLLNNIKMGGVSFSGVNEKTGNPRRKRSHSKTIAFDGESKKEGESVFDVGILRDLS